MKLLMQIAFTCILISFAGQNNFGGNANEIFNKTFSYYKVTKKNGKLKFYRRINKGTPLECITYLHLKHGTQVTIQTPNYPQNYPNNAKCPWLMTIPAKTKIIIKCESFHVLQGDVFIISNIFSAYSRNSLKSQTIIFEKRNELIMEFISDSQKTSSGFNCTVSSSYFKKRKRKKIMK